MISGLPALSHEQQQKAVERIQELMAQGMSSGEAITVVAAEIRATHTGEMVVARFEDEDEEEQTPEEHTDYGHGPDSDQEDD
ncbi:YoaH family protein [Enterobacteriaceae bacterium H16N7]|uniref:YoaH family protein n=1 Tax=Cedecea sulfonylureivorans TaxID=3051154 RepID=UPI001926B6A6|nr:YoaH family protein [Cedecea sulfonylureivorans]MCT4705888.1 YoaH family protein [Dryocola clanedunensis]